jgi:hypothetical protein
MEYSLGDYLIIPVNYTDTIDIELQDIELQDVELQEEDESDSFMEDASARNTIDQSIDQFLTDLSTRSVRTIPQHLLDDTAYLDVMKNQITEMFYNTESRYNIDILAITRQPNRCLRLVNGLVQCSLPVIYNTLCCAHHIFQQTDTDKLVLRTIKAGFELGEVLDILDNDIEPALQTFLRNETVDHTINHLENTIVPIINQTILNHVIFNTVFDNFGTPTYEDEEQKPELPRYEDITLSTDGIRDKTCPVCIEEAEKNIALGCSHNVCYECLEKLTKLTCPCCRTPIDIATIYRV